MPDYSQYSISELKGILNRIDQTSFPERYEFAKNELQKKLQNKEGIENRGTAKDLPPHAVKWSELLLSTRIILIGFLLLIFSVGPTMFYEFLLVKRWSESTGVLIWFIGAGAAVFWVGVLSDDRKFRKKLAKDWQGKLALVGMPFLFLIIIWSFINKSIPIALHLLSEKDYESYQIQFSKAEPKKFCPHRIRVFGMAEFKDSELCLSKSQRDHLPESGEIIVTGARSRFVFTAERLQLLE